MTKISNSYTIQKGDCPYTLAKNNLKNQGKKATNSAIVKEMNRLATLNGCKNVDEFGKKYFNSAGKKITFTGQPKQQNITQNKAIPDSIRPDTLIRAERTDALRVDTTSKDTIKFNKKHPVDSTRQDTTRHQRMRQVGGHSEISRINCMQNDTQKIITYNKKHAKGNYIILDKKTCKATIYNKAGQKLKSYEVLLGRDKGDDMSTAWAKDSNKQKYTTVPGEYTFTSKGKDFGGMYRMGQANETVDPDVELREWAPGKWGKVKFGKGFQAMHNTADRKHRDKLYNDGNLRNNRVSMGCPNIKPEDLKEMELKYGVKVGTKIYILPEERGNSLKLETQADGTTKFVTHYADAKQNSKRKRVQNQIAQGNINRKLQQKRQQQLAEQKAKEENFRWYNPSTWYIS